MTLLYAEPCFLEHQTGDHPEQAERIRGLPERLQQAGLAGRCRRPEFGPISRDRLTRVHQADYVDEIRAISASGGGNYDADTVIGPNSYQVALLAAGAVCDAAERLVAGEDTQALCLVRPPGHHALVDRGMGFCLFSNVALAARLATDELGIERVLIVDWDVHHGNGTQAVFWKDPRVGFLSIHRWPFYPGTGNSHETGSGDGLGTTLNVPVEFGISREDYHTVFAGALQQFAEKIKPQLVLISAGFDAHRLDPVGSLGLEAEDFGRLTDLVLDVAGAHAGGKLISVLEGGYHPTALADCVQIHLGRMLNRSTVG